MTAMLLFQEKPLCFFADRHRANGPATGVRFVCAVRPAKIRLASGGE